MPRASTDTDTGDAGMSENDGTTRPRGRPRNPDARARRRAVILEAAADIFARDGYADADMEDIASAAAVGKGTVYRYFPSKKDLFLAAVDHRVEGLGEYIDTCAAAASSTLDKMRAATEAYILWTDEHPHAVDLILQELAVFRDERKPRWFVFRDRRVLPWRSMIEESMAAGELRRMPPDRVTDLVSDALYGLMFSNRFSHRGAKPAEQTDTLLDILFRGILAAPAEGQEDAAPGTSPRPR